MSRSGCWPRRSAGRDDQVVVVIRSMKHMWPDGHFNRRHMDTSAGVARLPGLSNRGASLPRCVGGYAENARQQVWQAAGRSRGVTGGWIPHPVDAKSAARCYLAALWQKQGGEEETFSPAALQLYLYTRSIFLTRLLSYAYPTVS